MNNTNKNFSEFLRLSVEKYGDKFDYSLVEYKNRKTKIKIICPEHGIFEQQPRTHLSSIEGCPKCYHETLYLPFEEFLSKVEIVHENKYKYEKGDYKKTTDKIKCTCEKHGDFYCSVNNLLSGKGCKKCGIEKRAEKKRSTTEDFIKKAKITHGDRYNYDLVDYKGNKDKVVIVCREHGEFYQQPISHCRGQGCPYCSGNKSLVQTTEDFIKSAINTHGDKYLYKNSIFVNLKSKIEIECKIHGVFKQTARQHLRGAGCIKCAVETVKKHNTVTTEEFIKRAYKVHKNRYEYSNVRYEACNEKISITCKEHGEFLQTPEHHLRGSGCPICANKKYKRYGGSSELKYIAEKLRTRVRIFLKKNNIDKKHNTHELLGCSWVELREHLEKNPYGFKIDQEGLDLDHIIPLSTCETEEDLIRLNHYTNLQLLPRKYNQHIKRDNPWDKEDFEEWLKTKK